MTDFFEIRFSVFFSFHQLFDGTIDVSFVQFSAGEKLHSRTKKGARSVACFTIVWLACWT